MISVSFLAVKFYNPSSTDDSDLFLSGRVYTTFGGTGIAGRVIVVHVSYVYGGVTFNDVINLGPTDANGFATACPAQSYPANVRITVSTDPVNNGTAPPGPGFTNVQVQNQPQGAVPAFCP